MSQNSILLLGQYLATQNLRRTRDVMLQPVEGETESETTKSCSADLTQMQEMCTLLHRVEGASGFLVL